MCVCVCIEGASSYSSVLSMITGKKGRQGKTTLLLKAAPCAVNGPLSSCCLVGEGREEVKLGA